MKDKDLVIVCMLKGETSKVESNGHYDIRLAELAPRQVALVSRESLLQLGGYVRVGNEWKRDYPNNIDTVLGNVEKVEYKENNTHLTLSFRYEDMHKGEFIFRFPYKPAELKISARKVPYSELKKLLEASDLFTIFYTQ